MNRSDLGHQTIDQVIALSWSITNLSTFNNQGALHLIVGGTVEALEK
jgi:hypothetical protein